MLKHSFFFSMLFVGLVACQRETETIEVKNEFGSLERFERRKSDFARHGKYQRFYADGKTLAEEATYVNDTLDGEHRMYFENGKVEFIEHYNKGVQHGFYQKFRLDGSKEVEHEYVNSLIEGISTRYYPNGQVQDKVLLVHGEENGPFTEYHPNGKISATGTYKYVQDEAVEDGELLEYDSTGTLIRVADCVLGACRTRMK